MVEGSFPEIEQEATVEDYSDIINRNSIRSNNEVLAIVAN